MVTHHSRSVSRGTPSTDEWESKVEFRSLSERYFYFESNGKRWGETSGGSVVR